MDWVEASDAIVEIDLSGIELTDEERMELDFLASDCERYRNVSARHEKMVNALLEKVGK